MNESILTGEERQIAERLMPLAGALARQHVGDDESVSVAFEATCDALIRARESKSNDVEIDVFVRNFVLNRLREYRDEERAYRAMFRPIGDFDAELGGESAHVARRRRYAGRITKAGLARELGVTRKTIYNRQAKKKGSV